MKKNAASPTRGTRNANACPPNGVPTAGPRNHTPIICPLRFGGANCDTDPTHKPVYKLDVNTGAVLANFGEGVMVTPHGMVDLMVAMDRHPHRTAYIESLPIAGVDGTLAGRMRGTPAAGRIRAKTGTLAQTNALTGYATTREGDRLAFAIVLNHHTAATSGVAAIDEVAAALVR